MVGPYDKVPKKKVPRSLLERLGVASWKTRTYLGFFKEARRQ